MESVDELVESSLAYCWQMWEGKVRRKIVLGSAVEGFER